MERKIYRFLIVIVVVAAFSIPVQAKKVPDVKLTSTDNESFNLRSLEGDVNLIFVWASWCGWCKKQFSDIHKLGKKYEGTDVSVIGINEDKKTQNFKKFLKNNASSFPNLKDEKNEFAKGMKFRGVPSFLLVDGKGNILFKKSGYIKNIDKLEARIQKHLSSE